MDEKISMGIELSICIPNYNRIDQLKRLLEEAVRQITEGGFAGQVQICISDDCSPENPEEMVKSIQYEYADIDIRFGRNEENKGMDYNFLCSVRMASGKYCWIIGNDDMLEDNALLNFFSIVNSPKYRESDFIVTPFDCFSYDGKYMGTSWPLGENAQESMVFDTGNKEELQKWVMNVRDNSAMFGFLSNVIFKRKRWMDHGNMFDDKMGSIFIQVYMNIQTLTEGAVYLYIPEKIIKSYFDHVTNFTIERIYRVVTGLNDAICYFFSGDERKRLIHNVVDICVTGEFMELDRDDARREKIDALKSQRLDFLRKYYVKRSDRMQQFKEKPVIVYGAGKIGHDVVKELGEYGAFIIGVCDADKQKQGKYIEGKIIFDFETLKKEYRARDNCMIVIANYLHLTDIGEMLLKNEITNIAVTTTTGIQDRIH